MYAQADRIAVGKLVAQQVEIAILHIGVIAEGTRGGNAERPVAKAIVSGIIAEQCDLLRQQIFAMRVEDRADGGGAADHVSDAGFAHHLRNRRAGGLDLFRQLAIIKGMGQRSLNGLPLKRVLVCCCHLLEHRRYSRIIRVQHGLELNQACRFAV